MVPSTPGARTVTAGPAMRRSGCMARIAGSMKPQLRKWPMVAGSALTSFWTRRASREEGRGLRVNTAELLDVGERAIAQPADIAAGVDHVIAALEHLAPGGAGMRHAAHRLAALPDAFLGARDELRDLGMLQIAELSHGAGEIVRADEEHVDALDRGDRRDVLDRPGRLDLADDEELIRRRLAVLRRMNPIVGSARRSQRRAAPAGGRIAAGRDHPARVPGRFDGGGPHPLPPAGGHSPPGVCGARRHAGPRGA